jgi:hypothetical protein
VLPSVGKQTTKRRFSAKIGMFLVRPITLRRPAPLAWARRIQAPGSAAVIGHCAARSPNGSSKQRNDFIETPGCGVRDRCACSLPRQGQKAEMHTAARFPVSMQELLEKYSNGMGEQLICWDNGRFVNHSCNASEYFLPEGITV